MEARMRRMLDTALTEQITLAVIATYALQIIKKSKWFPWLTVESQKLNYIVGVVVAFGASVGVVATFDHTAGVLTITGLTWAGLGHGAARFIQQWVFQQVAYKNLIAPPMPGAMQAGAEKQPPVLALEPEPKAPKEK
jgi:hypothetical protein